MSYFRLIFVLTLSMSLLCNCDRKAKTSPQSSQIVVLYTSVDEPFVRPLIQQFTRETAIKVELHTDAEAAKTVGLSEKVIAEKDHPLADVYWGNEPFHTINMAEQGVFTPHASPAGSDVRDRWRDKAGLYQTIGLRARMIVVSTRMQDAALITKIHTVNDLADPALRGRIGMSNPAFGTASGQVAAWYLTRGDAATDAFLQSLKSNGMVLLGGNSAVVDQVAGGNLIAGFTDNDDIANGKADNQPVEAVVPEAGSKDALFMPTTIAMVKGAPHGDAAAKLIDFLMTAGVEKQLIDAHFLAFSARDAAVEARAMDVNDVEVAHKMPGAVQQALGILQGR